MTKWDTWALLGSIPYTLSKCLASGKVLCPAPHPTSTTIPAWNPSWNMHRLRGQTHILKIYLYYVCFFFCFSFILLGKLLPCLHSSTDPTTNATVYMHGLSFFLSFFFFWLFSCRPHDSNWERDEEGWSISAHGRLLIKPLEFNPNCQLDIIKLHLYKSKGKWTDLQSTAIWLGILMGILGLADCSQYFYSAR